MTQVPPDIAPSLLPTGALTLVVNGPHKEYNDLPAVMVPVIRDDNQQCLKAGLCISRWRPTAEELQAILDGGDIYVTILHDGQINPFFVSGQVIDWTQVDR